MDNNINEFLLNYFDEYKENPDKLIKEYFSVALRIPLIKKLIENKYNVNLTFDEVMNFLNDAITYNNFLVINFNDDTSTLLDKISYFLYVTNDEEMLELYDTYKNKEKGK